MVTKSGIPRVEWRLSEKYHAEDKLESATSELLTDQIIKRAQNGEAKAMTDLYNLYKPAIYRYLYHRSGTKQVAEELTTEVFIRVIENLPRYLSKDTPFQAWLFTIARNLMIDHFRRSRNHQYIELHENIVTTAEGPEVSAERNLNNEKLQTALKQLTPDQSDVIVLRFLAGMPISQVAQVMKKSQGSIKMLQSRALDALYQILKSNFEIEVK